MLLNAQCNDAAATRLLFDSSAIIAANAYNNLAVSAWLHSLCLRALWAANPDDILLTITGAFGTGTVRNVPNVPVMPRMQCVCRDRSRFCDEAIVIITSDIWTAGEMYILGGWGSGFSPPETEKLMAMRQQCRHVPVPLIIALGIPRVAFDWGVGGCTEATSVVPICRGFRRYTSRFQHVIYLFLHAVAFRSKMTRIEFVFKPIVTLNWNPLSNSPYKICCRNLSAPSARSHRV